MTSGQAGVDGPICKVRKILYFCGAKITRYESQLQFQGNHQRVHRAIRYHRHHRVAAHHPRPAQQGCEDRTAEGVAHLVRHPGRLPLRRRRPPLPLRRRNQLLRRGRCHHHLHLRHGDDPRPGNHQERRPRLRRQRRAHHLPADRRRRRADHADLHARRICHGKHHRGHRPQHGGGLLRAQIRRLGRAEARPNRNLHSPENLRNHPAGHGRETVHDQPGIDDLVPVPCV